MLKKRLLNVLCATEIFDNAETRKKYLIRCRNPLKNYSEQGMKANKSKEKTRIIVKIANIYSFSYNDEN